MIVLIRKNLLQQALSMMRASQLAEACGDAGWSRVNQSGWDSKCGGALARLSSSNVDINALRTTLQYVCRGTKELLEVRSEPLIAAFMYVLPHLIYRTDHSHLEPGASYSVLRRSVVATYAGTQVLVT